MTCSRLLILLHDLHNQAWCPVGVRHIPQGPRTGPGSLDRSSGGRARRPRSPNRASAPRKRGRPSAGGGEGGGGLRVNIKCYVVV